MLWPWLKLLLDFVSFLVIQLQRINIFVGFSRRKLQVAEMIENWFPRKARQKGWILEAPGQCWCWSSTPNSGSEPDPTCKHVREGAAADWEAMLASWERSRIFYREACVQTRTQSTEGTDASLRSQATCCPWAVCSRFRVKVWILAFFFFQEVTNCRNEYLFFWNNILTKIVIHKYQAFCRIAV